MAVLLAGAGYLLIAGDDEAAPPATTTTIGVGPPWPLTGVASAPGDPLDRPAVAVKVSAGDTARPQAGIIEADQVWEEQVEGISRFIAIFQSTDAAPVGPIRSARDSDVDLLQAFGTPVFVWGGANEGVAARVEASPLVSFNVDPDSAENSYRDDERLAPDNLFIDGTQPFFGAEGATAPVAQFGYRADGPPAGAATLGAEIDWGGSQVAYLWDDTRGVWARFQDGTPHVDAADELVGAGQRRRAAHRVRRRPLRSPLPGRDHRGRGGGDRLHRRAARSRPVGAVRARRPPTSSPTTPPAPPSS